MRRLPLKASKAIYETRAALASAAGSSRCCALAAATTLSASSSGLRAPRAFSQRARREAPILRKPVGVTALVRTSKDFYLRKRGEGKKTHHQATIALARKRVNVLWAMLRDGQPYRERSPAAAWLEDRDAETAIGAALHVASGPHTRVHGVDGRSASSDPIAG